MTTFELRCEIPPPRRKSPAERSKTPQVDRKRLTELRAEVVNLAEAVAGGLLRRSPSLARRLADAEAELANLEEAATRPAEVQRVVPHLTERFRAAVDRFDVTLAAADPERSRAALADLLPEQQRILLALDTTRTFLIAKTDIETPLERVAGGVSEIMVAGGRTNLFHACGCR